MPVDLAIARPFLYSGNDPVTGERRMWSVGVGIYVGAADLWASDAFVQAHTESSVRARGGMICQYRWPLAGVSGGPQLVWLVPPGSTGDPMLESPPEMAPFVLEVGPPWPMVWLEDFQHWPLLDYPSFAYFWRSGQPFVVPPGTQRLYPGDPSPVPAAIERRDRANAADAAAVERERAAYAARMKESVRAAARREADLKAGRVRMVQRPPSWPHISFGELAQGHALHRPGGDLFVYAAAPALMTPMRRRGRARPAPQPTRVPSSGVVTATRNLPPPLAVVTGIPPTPAVVRPIAALPPDPGGWEREAAARAAYLRFGKPRGGVYALPPLLAAEHGGENAAETRTGHA